MRDCFPTSEWRTLGLLPLPGKAACGVDIVLARLESLRAILPLDVADSLSHDELQALVARLAGVPSTRATQRASPRRHCPDSSRWHMAGGVHRQPDSRRCLLTFGFTKTKSPPGLGGLSLCRFLMRVAKSLRIPQMAALPL